LVNIVKCELLAHFVITHENYTLFCGYGISESLRYRAGITLVTKEPFNYLQITIVAFLWHYIHLHREY